MCGSELNLSSDYFSLTIMSTDADDITAQLAMQEEESNQMNDLKLFMQSLMSENMKSLNATVETLGRTVETLGKTLNGKIDGLSTSTAVLTARVEEVNKTIRDDLQKMETKINGDVEKISRETASIRETITKNKDEHDQATQVMKRELEEAYIQLDIQRRKFSSLEKSSQRSMQHSRGWNIEVDGIPAVIGDNPDDLEEAITKICFGIGVEFDECEIDTIHRLPSKQTPKPVIVRFVSRKTVRALHEKKHKLKYLSDLQIEVDGLTDDSKIFIRPSLSPYFNNLAFNCRVLKRKRLVRRVKVSNDGKIVVEKADGSYVKVSHESDLVRNFPLFDDFNFDYDRSFPRGDEEAPV